jgi:hypothetical protein
VRVADDALLRCTSIVGVVGLGGFCGVRGACGARLTIVIAPRGASSVRLDSVGTIGTIDGKSGARGARMAVCSWRCWW